MVERLTTTVASNGTSRVARNTPNTKVRPGNLRNANAYADRTDGDHLGDGDDEGDDRGVDERAPEVAVAPRLAQRVERDDEVGSSGCCSTLLPGFNAPTTIT